MKSIAVFNNKGGVGKTTLLCNIVTCLKEHDQRVLVIDADPQCNSTIYLFTQEQIEHMYSDRSKKTIYDLVSPIMKNISNQEYTTLPVEHSVGFDVDVIIGDTKLALAEDLFSNEWINLNTSFKERSLNSTFFLKRIFHSLENQYDYVFFDMGPSLGSLNRMILLNCDYFIIPMSSDIFSIKAIDNIGISLRKWKKYIDSVLSETKEDNDGVSFSIDGKDLIVNPVFLGYVSQQYNTKTTVGIKQPVKAYDRLIQKMPEKIEECLKDFYDSNIGKESLCIGSIPTMNSLIPLSQIASKPIFKLSGRDGVVGAHFKKVQDSKLVFDTIVNRLLNSINYYDRLER